MLFKSEDASLKIDVVNYELPAGEGAPDSDDCNWLVLRCTWNTPDGDIRKDTNSCLLTYELREMTAGVKVLNAGIRDELVCDFTEPYFTFAARAEGEGFRAEVSFYLPNTMDGDDTAEISAYMTKEEMRAFIDELDRLCERFPDRMS